MPDGVLINGKGPYRYNDSLVPEDIDYLTIDVHPGQWIQKLLYVIAVLVYSVKDHTCFRDFDIDVVK